MNNSRYANKRIKLRKGEYQRSNNTFAYWWFDKNGKRQFVYAKTLPELREKEEQIIRDTLDGIDYSKLDSTINSYFELWKEIKSGIRETTFTSYVRFYNRYVEPEFGKRKLKNITYSSVVMFLKNLAVEKGLSFGTIRNIKVVLSMVFDIAVKDGVLRSNPSNGTLRELQREFEKNTKDVRALTLEEQKLFESFLARPGHYHQYYAVFTTMLWTGMRVGEVLGLRWEAKSSIRTVPMLPKVREALLEEKEKQEQLGIRCLSEVDGYTNFIFLNSKGNVLDHKKLNNRLTQICKAINREIQAEGNTAVDEFPHVHNHMLRHTFATRMREAGADMKAVSDMMGHEGILITLTTYTDASREFKNREIALLQDYCESAM